MTFRLQNFLWATVLFFVSCNDGDNASVRPAATDKETILKNEMATYPDSLLLVENIIQFYRENGNIDRAVKVTNEALKRDSINARLWDIKATLLFEKEDTSGSIAAFEKAIEIFPEPAYIISLGTLYAQTQNPNALVMSDALLAGSKANADKEAYFIKGLYYTYTGNKRKAIGFFDKCLALNYTFMDAYLEKGLALYDLGLYKEAFAIFNRAVTLQNNFEEGYFYRGQCLEKLGRPAEAAESYKRALLYDPGYAEASDALAKLGYK